MSGTNSTNGMNDMTPQHDFALHHNAFGKLVMTLADGTQYEGVVPVRAFPISGRDQGIALVSTDGKELAWIERLTDLHGTVRTLVEDELENREFMPEIRQLHRVSSFATPSRWSVTTDRGETEFTLKGEEDIRRLTASMLLIADSHGVQFLVRDLRALDKSSRRLLDRFL